MRFTLEFPFRSISPQTFVRFSLNITQMFLSVSWCAKSMTQLHRLQVKVLVQAHELTLEFGVCSISPESFERFSLNFDQMLIAVRR